MLWLDAHTDIHSVATTESGNLHGTPIAYIAGRPGFDAFPPFPAPVPEANICLFGIRSVDPAEHTALAQTDIVVNAAQFARFGGHPVERLAVRPSRDAPPDEVAQVLTAQDVEGEVSFFGCGDLVDVLGQPRESFRLGGQRETRVVAEGDDTVV